jgi:hypothetical protein
MANGHSAEAIEATVEFSEDLRGPDGIRAPLNAGWEQQEQNEKQRQEEEWQKADEAEVDAIQLKSLTKKHEARMKKLAGENPPLTKRDFLNQLVKDHGLVVEEDIFNKEGKWAIIKLSGVEKIQNNLNIRVTFESEVIEKDFAVIKAVAVGQRDSVQSYGSAIKGAYPNGNVSHTYLVEMAEKRAKARAVLKLCGAYKYGVYSEDESEEFRQDS